MASATAERAVMLMTRLYREHSANGINGKGAMFAIAQLLGMTPRRVKAIRYSEAEKISPVEYATIQEKLKSYLGHRRKNLEQELIALQARKDGR